MNAPKSAKSRFSDASVQAGEAERKRTKNAARQAAWRERRRSEGLKIMAVPSEVAEVLKKTQKGAPLIFKAMSRHDLLALEIGKKCLSTNGIKRMALQKLMDFELPKET